MEIEKVDKKKAKYFKRVAIIYMLLLIYASISLYSVSKYMSIMFTFSTLIMWWALSNEVKRKKAEKPYIDDNFVEVIKVSGFKNSYLVYQIILPALVMFVLYFSEIIEGPIINAIIHVGVVFIGLFYCLYLLRLISTLETLMFEQGIYHQMIYYDFKKIIKHQFIPLKKGGYLFEVNNGKNLASIKINKDTYSQLNEILISTAS